MAHRNTKKGAYFLLPYSGPKKDNLVCVLGEYGNTDQWVVRFQSGLETNVSLSSSERIAPSTALQIINAKPNVKKECGRTDDAGGPPCRKPAIYIIKASKLMLCRKCALAHPSWNNGFKIIPL